MSKPLFNQFSAITTQAWKQQIQYELKGGDYNELVWESLEGIKVKPFYDKSDLPPLVNTANNNSFTICQEIYVHDVEKSAKRASSAISKGADQIRFIIPSEVPLDALTKYIPSDTQIYIEPLFLAANYIEQNQQQLQKGTARLLIDPINQLGSQGNWFTGSDNLQVLAALAKKIPVLSADSRLYQHAGANMVQQIAYISAHIAEIFNFCGGGEYPFIIQVAIGPNYFFEIAKLRAIRLLFHAIASEFNHTGGCQIIAMPSKRNKTIYDYNVNMLRTTTECMSAIIGGADVVQNLPYDVLYHKSNEFGERIARNQLLILKHESYFSATCNAADGSYFIENITQQLAEKSLDLFKQIENGGGFLKQLQAGVLQKKVAESAAKEQALFASGAAVSVGTNKYLNNGERMQETLDFYPFLKNQPRKTLVVPFIQKRLAETAEQDRLKKEKE